MKINVATPQGAGSEDAHEELGRAPEHGHLSTRPASITVSFSQILVCVFPAHVECTVNNACYFFHLGLGGGWDSERKETQERIIAGQGKDGEANTDFNG